MEAIQIYRKPEKENNLHYTPFVEVTANVMKGEEELCLQAGFDRFIAKPVDKQELQNVLQQFISTDKIKITK
jgi:CheY-like chemotaxis protein